MNVMEICCTPISGGLSSREAEDLASTLKVLADPARIRIISMLATAGDGEVCVCDLTDPLDLSQPTVSHHIKQLREAGFIESERRGKWIYHRLVPDRLADVRRALSLPEPAAV